MSTGESILLQVERPLLYIHGVGHFHPENVLDNDFLSSLEIETDDAWIMERVGIRSRRTVLPLEYIQRTRNADPREAQNVSLYTNAQTSAKATKMALDRAHLKPSDIGLVIAGGCSPQRMIPAEACCIAHELGITVPAFDLNSACTSFVAQLHFLSSLLPENTPSYILIVNPENTTRSVNYNDRATAVLWGDGTSAAVVSLNRPARLSVKYTMLDSDPSGWDKVVIPPSGHFVQQGSHVQTFAIKKSLSALSQVRMRSKRPGSIYWIGHQANLLMLNAVQQRGEILESRHLYNVDRFGNCGAAGAASVLSENYENLSAGDEIALVAVGSGLTWGGALLEVGS